MNKLTLEDLKVGDCVLRNGRFHAVSLGDFASQMVVEFRGIEVNRPLLIDLGFTIAHMISGSQNPLFDNVNAIHPSGFKLDHVEDGFVFFFLGVNRGRIDYLHQVQSLFLLCTGEDLDVSGAYRYFVRAG